MKIKLLLVTFALATFSSSSIADPSIKEMAARAKESLARDGSYEMASVQAFWGDASFMQKCASPNQPVPAPFVIYFEVLPNGTLGSTLFEPMTDTAKCIKQQTAQRNFPKPPGGTYVTEIKMSFRR